MLCYPGERVGGVEVRTRSDVRARITSPKVRLRKRFVVHKVIFLAIS